MFLETCRTPNVGIVIVMMSGIRQVNEPERFALAAQVRPWPAANSIGLISAHIGLSRAAKDEMRMADERDPRQPQLLELLEELERLEAEQRTLDLRDPQAIDEYERKIAALRHKINLLHSAKGASPRPPGMRYPG